jgi:hypothetical protein
MTHQSENLQPSLFEAERPCVELRAAQKSELATVIEVLLREIAAALAKAGGAAMTKITTEHLARSACVYIRQSTADQLAHNHESRRRQYGLVDRAKQLGWSNVDVIDDDLGRSGGGIARPRFRAAARNDLRGPCRRCARDRGVASCPQWPRLAYADRVLWIGRHAHRRRGRNLRILAIPTIGCCLA